MELNIFRVRCSTLMLILLVTMCSLSDCYDPLDPNGNVTVTFDILDWTDDGYVARVSIQNFYQYRHVDSPGWNLGWNWTRNEIIWSMSGAFATHQGDCKSYMGRIPHCCRPDPVIADLTPDASPQNMSDDCCRGGVLSAWAIDPWKSFSSFEITVGSLGNYSAYMPLNLTLAAPGPGYTCGPLVNTDPTVSSAIGGRREEQVFITWKSTCTYSSYVANKTPVCCVSLSSFYNPTVTSCPSCSCGCRPTDPNTPSCISEGSPLSGANGILDGFNPDIVRCTDHMCPLRVHWHIMTNYMDHWRVKLTISNYNYERNYSNWNVLVQHPGFSQSSKTYSFNSTVLSTAGVADEVALFWGLQYYNNDLLQAKEKQLGSLTTQILLRKDTKSFTLGNGWGFPRRIYVNGENCEMPPPVTFPALPNGSSRQKPTLRHFLLLFVFYLIFKTPIV